MAVMQGDSEANCEDHQFPEEETPEGVRLLLPCLNCGLAAGDALMQLRADFDDLVNARRWRSRYMSDESRVIERRLRDLAAKFTGTAMSHRLPTGDHGAARELVVSFLDDKGSPQDVGDELLSIADDVAMLDGPKVIKHD